MKEREEETGQGGCERTLVYKGAGTGALLSLQHLGEVTSWAGGCSLLTADVPLSGAHHAIFPRWSPFALRLPIQKWQITVGAGMREKEGVGPGGRRVGQQERSVPRPISRLGGLQGSWRMSTSVLLTCSRSPFDDLRESSANGSLPWTQNNIKELQAGCAL